MPGKRILVAGAACAVGVAQTTVNVAVSLDPSTALHRYDGHGALSAGASSRLLWDYAEPYRSQILDYLFKPSFGAALHTLKVEIGGDAQSTDGTEPSHEHYRGDLSCTRGFELWLAQQALARNPSVQLYGLSWGVPAWVGNGTYYSDDNVAYQTAWVTCMTQQTGAVVNYLGLWNEKPQPDLDYIVQLRQALDAAGHTQTKLIVMDGGFDDTLYGQLLANASANAAIDGAGLHYPCDAPHPEVRAELGKTFWASEDYSRDPAWSNGGTYWGKALSQNYVLMNMTSTIAWSLIWSTYTNFVCNGAGLMRAYEPWSGYYEASAPIWMSAHWTQFVQPGWRFLHTPGGGSGMLSVNGTPAGTYVTLVPPTSTSDVTIIIETLYNNDCIKRQYADFNISFTLEAGMPAAGATLYVWRTTSTSFFTQLSSITVDANGRFNVSVAADSIMTVSTISTAAHGSAPGPVPSSAPFPIPYSDNFNSYAYDALATYFADQGGSWAVRNGSLVQVAPADPGNNAWAPNPDPLTIIGDPAWDDYAVSASVTFSGAAPIPSGAHLASASGAQAPATAARRMSSMRREAYRGANGSRAPAASSTRAPLRIDTVDLLVPCDSTPSVGQTWAFNAPADGYLSVSTSQGAPLCLNVGACGNDVILYECVTTGGTCCGADCYTNLQWTLAGNGSLITQMDGTCVTVNGSTPTLYTTTCAAGTPNQTWAYNATSGQLQLVGTRSCLGYTVPRPYAQVCGRITSFNGFNAVTSMDGYCVRVDDTGAWALTITSAAAATGSVTGFVSTQPHTLSLSMAGSIITAYMDGVQLVQLSDGTYATGNAALGSGFHTAAFDNFVVTAP